MNTQHGATRGQLNGARSGETRGVDRKQLDEFTGAQNKALQRLQEATFAGAVVVPREIREGAWGGEPSPRGLTRAVVLYSQFTEGYVDATDGTYVMPFGVTVHLLEDGTLLRSGTYGGENYRYPVQPEDVVADADLHPAVLGALNQLAA